MVETRPQNPEAVVCADCRCLVEKATAQEIKVLHDGHVSETYYCWTHKKPYSDVLLRPDGSKYFRRQIEVDIEGTPVGYVARKRSS